LGSIADRESTNFLLDRARQAKTPTAQQLAIPLLRCAVACENASQAESATAIYNLLSQPGQPRGARRAALEGLLRMQDQQATDTIIAWFSSSDPERRQVALAHLSTLPDDRLDQLFTQLPDLPDASQMALIELATARRGTEILPMVTALAKSDKPELQLAGVRCLGVLGDASVIPVLMDMLADEDAPTEAVQEALVRLPRKQVTSALLEALRQRPDIRISVIAVLIELKCYDAIDPLVVIASHPDPAIYDPALQGLRGIADPDKTDIPRLVKLLLKTERGRHRDEVEKTILIVSDKLPAGADRSELVRAALAGVHRSESPKYLPLLGRLGGSKSLEMIRSAMASAEPSIREAAVRALCNWPNADVADDLLELARDSENKTFRHWSLRAYVRVITLSSDRPEAQTLAMLQNAMQLAENAENRQLVIQRTSTVRTMAAVDWIAGYLDDPALGQAACQAIVELAHHRFLRHPNMNRFGPILDKVGKVSTDPDVVERAKRYRLGL
jgi:HEAT repeat protein